MPTTRRKAATARLSKSKRSKRSKRSKNVVLLKAPPEAIAWVGGVSGYLSLTEQTLLPAKVKRIRVRDTDALFAAIRRLAVRGAPAIGIAAGYGVVLGVRGSTARTSRAFLRDLKRTVDYLASSRPTAVNLFWALDRMMSRAEQLVEAADNSGRKAAARRELAIAPVIAALLEEAKAIHAEDRQLCADIGRHGSRVLKSGWQVLTHCNAGALATGGSGTALSVVYGATQAGKSIRVFADETRPLLQGARLTAWELQQAGVEVTVLCDNAAASLMHRDEVQCVVTGADRIAANGDVANKIGTYGVAVLAREHGIPFYVAAPSTTFDLSLKTGKEIPIEERAASEVAEGFGQRTVPRGVSVYNPAFDVTPARYITGLITEVGVLRRPFGAAIRSKIRPVLRRN